MSKAPMTQVTRLYMKSITSKASRGEIDYNTMQQLKEAAIKMVSEIDQAIARMPAAERTAYLRGIL